MSTWSSQNHTTPTINHTEHTWCSEEGKTGFIQVNYLQIGTPETCKSLSWQSISCQARPKGRGAGDIDPHWTGWRNQKRFFPREIKSFQGNNSRIRKMMVSGHHSRCPTYRSLHCSIIYILYDNKWNGKWLPEMKEKSGKRFDVWLARNIKWACCIWKKQPLNKNHAYFWAIGHPSRA